MSCAQAQVQSDESIAHQHDESVVVPGAAHLEQYLPLLTGKSVACVVNHSSLIGETHLVDTLQKLGITVSAVFAPEHGFRGTADAGEHLSDGRDRATGVPVISLYGDRKKPSAADLHNVDILVFDIQDVGVRFYTYISTMHLVMEACAENDIPVVVLDRPNPNGYYVDGPVLDPEYRSFVGMHEIPVVYGMTIGELARMINGEGWMANGVKCNLNVIPCTGYDHTMSYDLPVPPSPNLPNQRSILLYPSICFFEGTEVSVGRGTNLQFQVIGHPSYTRGTYLFTPVEMPGAKNPPLKDVAVRGTNLSDLSVREIMSWRKLNLTWVLEYASVLQPKDHFFLPKNNFFENLAGTANLRAQILQGLSEEEIRASWQADLDTFLIKRKPYLLYPDFE
jgi:uncharacterized protein YbbC (DUF1343 family)